MLLESAPHGELPEADVAIEDKDVAVLHPGMALEVRHDREEPRTVGARDFGVHPRPRLRSEVEGPDGGAGR